MKLRISKLVAITANPPNRVRVLSPRELTCIAAAHLDGLDPLQTLMDGEPAHQPSWRLALSISAWIQEVFARVLGPHYFVERLDHAFEVGMARSAWVTP